MAKLSLTCLGSLQALFDGQAVTGFKSDKVRAMLVYLAVESDRPHRRDFLGGLLWPDWTDREALSNVRYALSNLRTAIGDRKEDPPFLHITRDTIQFNAASDYWLDVQAFKKLLDADKLNELPIGRLSEAIELYRGDFLEAFSIGDSAAFDDWTLLTRERLARRMSAALHSLASAHEQLGEFDRAQTFARRQIEREPWNEAAHRQLMKALALGGQRGAALAHYNACRRTLADELGIEPSTETNQLYERIRDGELVADDSGPGQPHGTPAATATLPGDLPTFESVEPIFVARETELAQLRELLELALTGHGNVAFVTGEAGSGKTALLREFVRISLEQYEDLCAAGGNCNAFTGLGDPYLPFREILELLTGEVRPQLAAGAITREHALRLWRLLPISLKSLVQLGPGLLDTFVPLSALESRAESHTPGASEWLDRAASTTTHLVVYSPGAQGPLQSDLFEQYERVLRSIARSVPLLLVVDDLQWSDLGSISLLFHLGRRLAGSRILILGSYRPEELAVGRDGQRHPLAPVVNEFRRDYGENIVHLGATDGQHFIQALLDQEPNKLGSSFRRMLHKQTRGHPLFTIELLRGLQERGDLVRDNHGHWVEGPALNWEKIPGRVEAVIGERISRLPRPLQAALRAASVEGEVFTGEVLAHIQATDEHDMWALLSDELDRRHRLVKAQNIGRSGTQLLSRYRFRHFLIQRYLYGTLDDVERVHLHEQVGLALEQLFGATQDGAELALQLARHFEQAQLKEKAIHYLHSAALRATRLSAYKEAVPHLRKALNLLESLPDSDQRQEQELGLQLAMVIALIGEQPGPERERAHARARTLCEQLGRSADLSLVLAESLVFQYISAKYGAALELAEETILLAERSGEPLLIAQGHWCTGLVLFSRGEFAAALQHLRQVTSFYEPQVHHQAFVELRGLDPGLSALAYEACCMWCLGYPQQALDLSQNALEKAREFGHEFTMLDVLCYAGCMLYGMSHQVDAHVEVAQEFAQLAEAMGLAGWKGSAMRHLGVANVVTGDVVGGLDLVERGLEVGHETGVLLQISGHLGWLALAQAKAGQIGRSWDTLAKAFAHVEETGERFAEAELYRIQSELLLMQDEQEEAESSLLTAIEIAQRQEARSWELRATTSLAQLWRKQGRTADAKQRLQRIYNWFAEGFETPDLVAASSLLQELS